MKNIKITFTLMMALSLLLQTGLANAQMSKYKFKQQFDKAFALIVEGEYEKAIPTLTKLHESDTDHGQVAFLLGMCQVKIGNVSADSYKILANACKKYDYFHQRGVVEDHSAPARSWFYLATVSEELGMDNAAISAYRNYMSCIPMASIDHKREIVYAIKEVKQHIADQAVGVSSLLASTKP